MDALRQFSDADLLWCWAVIGLGALVLAAVAVGRWWLLRRRGEHVTPLDWSRDTDCMLDDLVERTQVRWQAAVEACPPEPEAVRRQRESLELARAKRDNPDTVAMIRGWPAAGSSVPVPLGWTDFGPGPGIDTADKTLGPRKRRPREAATQY